MTRQLRVVRDPREVAERLRAALSGGDAILPVAAEHGATGADGHHDLPETVEQRIALVVETSGSTGRPKRVALSADALLANAAASESALGGPGQWVLALPTHYIAGLNVLTRSIAAGTEPVTVAGERFTASDFRDACARLQVPERFVSLVPAQLATLLDDDGARQELARFQAVLVGGQATPRALADRAREAGIRVVRSYGSSETAGGCVYDGMPTGTTAVRIVDGEVQLGGPSLAEGYLGDPELTAERFVDDREGAGPVRWFRTADAGHLDGERLVVSGRRDDVIISGGVKVALAAVERVLREQPGFADAVVVGAADARWGQVPVAFTEARGGRGASPESVTAATTAAIAAVGRELGPAARPSRIETLDELPLLSSGKPDRRALTRRAAPASDPTA